jgi:DNA modification methylase
MTAKLMRNRNGLSDFENMSPVDSETHVFGFNTINGIPSNIIEPNSVDIVLTSPPYGDSQTTVAYGQYSRLANEWLGFTKANQIDKMLMGGRKVNHDIVFGSKVLNEKINLIKKEDSKRAQDVVSFYQDYENSINNVAKTVKHGGYVCYVVGNRTVKGITIPTDEITAQLFEMNGFRHVETIARNIPNKRMPLKNSPSNIAGITANTMKNEYIVICKKEI